MPNRTPSQTALTDLTDQRGNRALLGVYEPGREGPHLEVAVHRGDDGSIVVQIDTGESLSGDGAEQLRVNVNDGAVYSGHVDRGDYDMHFVSNYATELAALHRS